MEHKYARWRSAVSPTQSQRISKGVTVQRMQLRIIILLRLAYTTTTTAEMWCEDAFVTRCSAIQHMFQAEAATDASPVC